jgi:phosphoglycerate dehydrogenase-like enzyme
VVRGVLDGAATLAGTGAGWGAAAAPAELLSRAAVVLARSLHELSPAVLSHLRGVPAVVLLSPWEGATEDALAAELGVARVLRVAPAADEERADTVLALLLALVRRTHALSRALARGAWLPPAGAYRGARRCSGMRLGLVGLDGCVRACGA